MPAHGQKSGGGRVLAGQEGKRLCDAFPQGGGAGQIVRGVLYSGNAWQIRQSRAGVWRDIHNAPTRNIVKDNRQRRSIVDGLEVGVKPLLRRFVIIRRNDQKRIRAAISGLTGQGDGFGCRIRAGSGNNRHTALDGAHAALDNAPMFVMSQNRRFPRCSAGHERARAGRDLAFDQGIEGVKVYGLAVFPGKGCDERRDGPSERAGGGMSLLHRVFSFSPLSLILRRVRFKGLALFCLLAACFSMSAPVAAGVSAGASAPAFYNPAQRDVIVRMIRAARDGDWKKARDLAASSGQPLAGTIYAWLVYDENRDSVEFVKLSKFLETHPDWPRRAGMRLAAEDALPDDISDARVLAFFKDDSPRTAPGMRRYLDALLKAGDEKKARSVLTEWWRRTPLPAPEQTDFIKRYGRLISQDSHRIRVDALLEARSYTAARAIAPSVGKGYEAVVEARIAIAEGKRGINALIDRIPKAYRYDPGLDYDRLVYRRRAEDNAGAMSILRREPAAAKLSNPAQWWRERHILARRLIESGDYRKAYDLVKGRGGASPETKAEAEWLSGWLAFRFLKRPAEALTHFETLYRETNSPISRSRAAYWAGLAARDMGRPDVATRWFQTAATYQTAFYGQMAAGSLSADDMPPLPPDPVADVVARQVFGHDDLVQTAKFFDAAGWHDHTALFLDAIAQRAKSPQDFWLAADLAFGLGHIDGAVRIARKAAMQGVVLSEYAYPTQIARMRGVDLEWALVHALIRQESGFDSDARSSAGAMGLMQLMPATAREVAKREGLSHQTDWLVRPEHNIRLGTAYFQTLLDRFDGSYALALAGYNAGPARVDRWIKEFGDPRDGSMDLAGWVERIPISETRNYVQRVLEGVYVYRIKLRDVQKKFDASLHVAARE